MLVGCATAPPVVVPPDCGDVRKPALCAELLAMRDSDQAVRKKMLADRDNPEVRREVETVDRQNVARVRRILDSTGWPGKSRVGEKGSGAAWTVIQHADPEVQKRYLDMMQKAVDAGELHGGLFATTVDRIRVSVGRPQLYGTQFREVDGTMQPFPIENEAEVDARRAQVGLQPLSEYAAMINEVYARQKKP